LCFALASATCNVDLVPLVYDYLLYYICRGLRASYCLNVYSVTNDIVIMSLLVCLSKHPVPCYHDFRV